MLFRKQNIDKDNDKRSAKPFTLVELLVVIAIVIVLYSILSPAFENVALGKGVDRAAREVMNQLHLTRQYAISNRTRAGVIFAWPDGSDDYYFPNSEFKHTAFGSFKISGKSGIESWQMIEGTDWGRTPQGTIISEVSDRKYASTSSIHLDNDGSAEGGDEYLKSIVFTPSGKLDTNENSAVTIKVQEGFYEGGSITTPNADNWVEISVHPYTGRIKQEAR
jgi:type II secretory pathway pseudopilin PulG